MSMTSDQRNRINRGESVTLHFLMDETEKELSFEYLGGRRWLVKEGAEGGAVKMQPYGSRDIVRLWVCEYCGATYGEYVNGCPCCDLGEVGTSSKVVPMIIRIMSPGSPVQMPGGLWAWEYEVVKKANIPKHISKGGE